MLVPKDGPEKPEKRKASGCAYRRPAAPMRYAVVLERRLWLRRGGIGWVWTEDDRVLTLEYPDGVDYWDQCEYFELRGGRRVPANRFELIGESDSRDGGPSSSYPTADGIRDAYLRGAS